MKTKSKVVARKSKTAKETANARITSEISERIEREAESIVSKSNIRKYDFPKDKVAKMLRFLYRKSKGRIDFANAPKFAAGYCDERDTYYPEVNAIISLMKKHHPNEIVVVSVARGRKVLIVGDVAEELLSKSKLNWSESHITSSCAKVPIELPLKAKLKSFGNSTISSEIERLSKKCQKPVND